MQPQFQLAREIISIMAWVYRDSINKFKIKKKKQKEKGCNKNITGLL